MNRNMEAMLAHAERVTRALRIIAACPAAAPFDFSGHDLNTALLQFFPVGDWYNDADRMAEFAPFAELIGGTWAPESDEATMMETKCATFPGLEGITVVVHAVRIPPGFVPKPKTEDCPFL